MRLSDCLDAWGSPDFARLFKAEVAMLKAHDLSLQQQLRRGNVVLDDGLEAMILRSREEDGRLFIKAGIFFRGINSGSCCVDDPTPVEPHEEYCEMEFCIDRATGETKVTPVT